MSVRRQSKPLLTYVAASSGVPSVRALPAANPAWGPRARSHAPGKCDRRAERSLRWTADKRRSSWISLRLAVQRSSTSASLSPFNCGPTVGRSTNGNPLQCLVRALPDTTEEPCRSQQGSDRSIETRHHLCAQKKSGEPPKGLPASAMLRSQTTNREYRRFRLERLVESI